MTEQVDIRSLPQDAIEIASLHVTDLGIPNLQDPLTNFLHESAKLRGIKGLGLVNWRHPGVGCTYFSVYAFADLRKIRGESQIERESIRGISQLFDILDNSLRRCCPTQRVRSELSYVQTGGMMIDSVFPRFKQDLLAEIDPEDKLSIRDPEEYFTQLTLARI